MATQHSFPYEVTAGETFVAKFGRVHNVTGIAVSFTGPTNTYAGLQASENTDPDPIFFGAPVWMIEVDTTNWAAGNYTWQALATLQNGVKRMIARAVPLLVAANIATLTPGGDLRTGAQQMVDAINAMLLGNASVGVRRYKINNRELERYGVAELLQLLRHFELMVAKEKRKALHRSVLGPTIHTRF